MTGAVIESVLGTMAALAGRFRAVDPLELTSEQRSSPHLVGRTVGQREVRISLPRGTELLDGDVLGIEGDTAIVVKAAAEDLFELRPGADETAWWAACYQLGNLHRPARFTADGVLTPFDPLLADVFRAFGIRAERVTKPFTGKRYGAVGADHGHSPGDRHSHGHSHVHAAGHHHGHGHG